MNWKRGMKVAKAMAVLGAALGLASPAAALRFELSSPSVAFPASYSAEGRAKVMAALNRRDCTFVKGHGLNSFTSISYRGEARALNGMATALAGCPGASVSVTFVRKDEEWDWRVGHTAHGNSFRIEVNAGSKRLDLEQLRLPVRAEAE